MRNSVADASTASSTAAADRDEGVDLARVQWAHRSRPYRALGHDFVVRTTDPHLGAYLDELFRSFAVGSPPDDAVVYSAVEVDTTEPLPFRLYRDTQLLASMRERRSLLRRLLWHLNRAAITDTTDHLLVHASAAEWRGTALVFPAPMESGKTTLIAGLVRAGFRYLTDETVAIHPDTLEVQPFPRALSVDPGSWEVLRDLQPMLHPAVHPYQGEQWQVPPDSIRAGAVAPPSKPGFVVVPRYRPGNDSHLLPLRRAEAVRHLGENSFNFQDFGDDALRVLAAVVRRSSCFRLEIGDLDRACALMTELVETSDHVPTGEQS